jgi:hypothetical protein
MPSKPFWESKTFWANLIIALVAVLELANVSPLPLPEGSGEWLIFAAGVLNILLRFVTTQPVTMTDENKQSDAPS